MKIKTIWNSIKIALIFPLNTSAFAVVSQPNFFSMSNLENIKMLKTIEIAQENLSSEDVSKKLLENKPKILDMLNEFSEAEKVGEKLLWESMEIENVDKDNINLKFKGRLFKAGSPVVRLTLNMKRNNSDQFNFNDYSYNIGSRCDGICKRRYIAWLNKLPTKFSDFDETIKEMFEGKHTR